MVLISGMILFTTIIGFIIVIEVLFHYTAAITYLKSSSLFSGISVISDMPEILIELTPVIITSVLFILVQLLAFTLAYRKVLKVRPIIALRKVGE